MVSLTTLDFKRTRLPYHLHSLLLSHLLAFLKSDAMFTTTCGEVYTVRTKWRSPANSLEKNSDPKSFQHLLGKCGSLSCTQ